ncbi:MAG: hypothetical protein KTR32_19280 [Granulosicoccus sp.]|nr:hypothetical protein [Granulosicoccus sp.]
MKSTYTIRAYKIALTIICLLTIQACASSGALQVARDQFRNGSTESALHTLSEADVSNRDRLLLYLDKGLVYQAAERYADSVLAFESALKLVEELDYFSVRDQTTSLVSSDWAIRYSGESSERLWIHTFQMINYLMLDQAQSAAVEARRAVAVIDEHGDTLKQDLFTRYLMALSFEAAGQRDSAMVEYRKLEGDHDLSIPAPLKNNERELILLFATGFIQPKLPGNILIDVDARLAFPYYPETFESQPSIDIEANGVSLAFERIDTDLLSVSRRALERRGKAVAARQALRLAAKYNLAEQISEEDAVAGGLAKLFLLAIEQADTRSWETLPAHLSIVRVLVPADGNNVTVTLNDTDRFYDSVYRVEVPVSFDNSNRNFRLIRVGISDS